MSHWRGGIFPQPGFSLKLLLSGPNSREVKVGSETPKGTPSFSVRGNSQSGSPERDAKCDTKSRRKGCPGHRSWRCLGPRIARSSSRSASCLVNPGPGKGHDQGAQSSQWGNSPQLFRISGHRGHGRWEVWVHCSTRAYGVCLRVELPVQAGLRGVLASRL